MTLSGMAAGHSCRRLQERGRGGEGRGGEGRGGEGRGGEGRGGEGGEGRGRETMMHVCFKQYVFHYYRTM